jgi:hypothetical protein
MRRAAATVTTEIDNPYLPMAPGTRRVHQGGLVGGRHRHARHPRVGIRDREELLPQ